MILTTVKAEPSACLGRESLSQRQFTIALSLITISAAALYLALAIYSAKFSRAEVFFAECSREMVEAHNYVTPLYHRQPFFDKPILVYWLIIAMFKIFGISHWAARLPSIIAALSSVVVTGLATKDLFGRRAGAIAAAILPVLLCFSLSPLLACLTCYCFCLTCSRLSVHTLVYREKIKEHSTGGLVH